MLKLREVVKSKLRITRCLECDGAMIFQGAVPVTCDHCGKSLPFVTALLVNIAARREYHKKGTIYNATVHRRGVS